MEINEIYDDYTRVTKNLAYRLVDICRSHE